MLKKFLAALICMAAVLGGAVLVSATTNTEAIINYVDMQEGLKVVTDEYGDGITINYAEVSFDLKNECGVEMEFAPFVAFYSSTRLVDVVRAQAQEIEQGWTGEFSVTSEIAYAENADSCKVFVFDDNLVPYADVAEGELNASDNNDIASDNYAYFIRARAGSDGWNETIMVQRLDKSGEVYTAYLADTIDIANANAEIQDAASMSGPDETVDFNDIDYNSFAELLANQLVTYGANSAGDINAITFASYDTEEELSLYAAGNATFDEENREVTINGKRVTITDDTIVFFIKGTNTITGIGDKDNIANVSYSRVATGAAVNNINGYAAAYDVDDGVARVLVILNATAE